MTSLNPHSRVSLKSDRSAQSFRYAYALRAASYVQALTTTSPTRSIGDLESLIILRLGHMEKKKTTFFRRESNPPLHVRSSHALDTALRDLFFLGGGMYQDKFFGNACGL